MKRVITFLILLLFASSLFQPVYAQTVEKMMIAPLPPNGSFSILGQNHKYTVLLRGNGEAIVTAQIVFSNQTTAKISSLTYRVPRVTPDNLQVYQIIRDPVCRRYLDDLPRIQLSPAIDPSINPRCAEYEYPNFDYYWDGGTKYQKATTSVKGDEFTITLPKIINPNQTGSILITFRGVGYVKKTITGALKYTFETLKVNETIENLQIGITTDSDLFLKGVKGSISYRFTDVTSGMETAKMAAAPIASQQLDEYIPSIGSGEITKTAKSLQPLDSYTVRGSYADARWKLYMNEIFWGIIIGILFISFIWFVIRLIMKRMNSTSIVTPKSQTVTQTNNIVLVASVSFISSLILAGSTICSFMIITILNNNSFLDYDGSNILKLLILLISFGLWACLLFLPTLFIAIKKGVSWAIANFALTIMWLIAETIVVILIMLIMSNQRIVPYSSPIELMKSTVVQQESLPGQ